MQVAVQDLEGTKKTHLSTPPSRRHNQKCRNRFALAHRNATFLSSGGPAFPDRTVRPPSGSSTGENWVPPGAWAAPEDEHACQGADFKQVGRPCICRISTDNPKAAMSAIHGPAGVPAHHHLPGLCPVKDTLCPLVPPHPHTSQPPATGNIYIQDFAWRQWWDPLGEFDCLTHNMPYHSYSISGTCGPFHGVCDYFDFRSVGQITPYSLKHTPITAANVRNQSELLLSMYRRTASLLQHNVLLQPLGDDFRYDYNVEFDQQYRNYKAIAEYLNTHRDKYRVEVQFGTLSDYFSSLRERQTRFPSLQGDFFPLAHEPGNYWTGYFSSRPFWKGAVRDLESELRAAELLFTYAYLLSSLPSQHNQHDEDVNKRMMNVTQLEAADKGNKDKQILTLVYSLLSTARAELAVFQHHDGITGTSRAAVMADYGRRLRRGIADARRAQAWGVSLILLDNDHVSSNGVGVTNKEPRHLAVLDQDGKPLDFQVNPLSGGVQDGEYIISRAWFEVEVLVAIGPLGFAFLRVASLSSSFGSHHPKHNKVVLVRSHLRLRSLTSTTTTTMDINTSNTMKNASSPSISVAGHKNHDDDDDGFVEGPRLVADDQQEQQLSFRISNSRWQLECHSASGLPVRLQDRRSGVWHPLSVQLRAYDPVAGMSGAYSSMFRGQSRDMLAGIRPHSVITEGQLVSTVRTFYNDFANLTFSLLKEPASLSEALQVQLTLHMRGHPLNAHQFRVMAKEVFLRIKTGLRDVGGAFYTDSSGLHMTKRFIIDDLHAAANYYPMTSMFYIQETTSINKEDKKEEGKQKRRRVTVVSGQSHGVTASAAPGVMDVMLDRTAHVDDHKGLGEGVEDPKRTAFKFALLLEEEEHHHHHPSAMADAAASGQSHQDYKDDAPFHPQDAQQQQQHEEELLPSAIAVAVARHLAHPPVLFLLSSTSDNVSASVAINNDDKKISAILAGKSPIAHSSMLVKSLPCNMHLLNMRFNWRRQKHRQGTSATTKTTGISSMDNIIDPQDHVIKMGKKEVLVTLHHQGVNRGFQCSLSSSLCSQAASVATSDRVSLMLNSKAFGGLQVVRTSLTGLHDFPSSKQGEEEKDTKTIKKKPTTAVPSPSVDADKRKQLPMNEQPNNFNDDAVNVDDSGQWRVHCRVMQLCSFKFLVSPAAAAATLPIT
ncbi:unnamed protein product [Notodromas monacha]|uniref:Glycoside hydrolase family 38 central domain-containing protein n=1 Tax=Notodromas monacha TaxID=399045 RepID=A0A7R9GDP3_9CRUS|nr:unnamed protein product [Notodromas monacha]CAG0917105.1 unnamed protein product [Notodromas monacha]